MRDRDVQAVRGSYGALNSGDIEATLAALAPDVEWHESSALPDAGTFRGRDAVGAFLDDFLQSWERFHQEVEEVVVEGDRVALMIHLTARGRGSGADVDARYAHVWTLRDGLRCASMPTTIATPPCGRLGRRRRRRPRSPTARHTAPFPPRSP